MGRSNLTGSDSGIGPDADPRDEDEAPPILGSWNALYTVVLVYAFVLVLIFYGLSVTLDFSGS